MKNHTSIQKQHIWILRIEGLLVLIASLYLYNILNENTWKMFILLFFLPDIALLGYFGGKKIGAIAYNFTHSYITPLTFWIVTSFLNIPGVEYLVIIWISHIGFDRALGYGLKDSAGFKYTHLGAIGNK